MTTVIPQPSYTQLHAEGVMRRARSRISLVAYEDRFEAQVLACAREMQAESLFHRELPMNEAKLLQQLRAAGVMPLNVYFKIAVRNDEVLGGFFGQISSIYFSDARVAKDLAWFVKRSSRGSAAAVALLADFEEWANVHGASHVVIGQSTGVKMEQTKSLYERLGYSSLGFNTMKRIA